MVFLQKKIFIFRQIVHDEGVEPSIWGKYQQGRCNSELDSRMFYKAGCVSSGQSSFLSCDTIQLVLISGDMIKFSGRSLHFMCVEFKILLAIIGLVCLEARVKFKNIDFQTEANFACYCIYQYIEENGRTYHKFKAGKYLLLNDEIGRTLSIQKSLLTETFQLEQDRLDLQY